MVTEATHGAFAYDSAMKTDRRRFCSLIALAGTAAAHKSLLAQSDGASSDLPAAGAGTVGEARVLSLEKMTERKTATGAGWSVAHGTLATGETVNLHESIQEVGAASVQLHTIQHSEFLVPLEGEIEFKHEASGQIVTERAKPGDVIYIALGTRHAVHNVGSVPARYLVVGIGGDAK